MKWVSITMKDFISKKSNFKNNGPLTKHSIIWLKAMIILNLISKKKKQRNNRMNLTEAKDI